MRLRSETAPIRIALDPELRAGCGPELTWAWRLLLTAIGRPWVEVRPGEACEIAHLSPALAARTPAPISIRADPDRWRSRDEFVLGDVEERQGWSMLRFGAAESGVGGSWLDGRLAVEHDVVFDLFWLATAAEERRWARNSHGHPQPAGPLQDGRLFTRALASRTAARLEQALSRLGLGAGAPRWPGGKRAALCLSHDVDYPEVVRWLEPLRVLRRRGARGIRPGLDVLRGRRHTWHFDTWLALEERVGARSAFYFVARRGSMSEYARGTPDPFYDVTAPRFRETLRRLNAAGAEVGLHASYRAYSSRPRFETERGRLEAVVGTQVVGNRHHYLHLDPARPDDTLALHDELGFLYDTTLGHDRQLGWRNGLALPFFPFHSGQRRELQTLQLPFAWMDQQLFLYGDLNPGEPLGLLRDLVETTAAQGGCLLLNIHEYTFDEELFPGWRRTYGRILEEVAARGDFWIETPRRVAEHWCRRAERILAASSGLGPEAAPRPPRLSRVGGGD